MKPDIEPIVQILSIYVQRIELNEEDLDTLRTWLMESELNEELFDDISNRRKWEKECPAHISSDLEGTLERIRTRMLKNLSSQKS